jgi:hypothetical protein
LKNLDYAVKKTVNDLFLSNQESEVKALVDRYWQEVYDKIVNGLPEDKSTLFLRNIGMFTVSRYKLNNFIKKKIGKIKGMAKSEKYSDETKKEVIERHKKKLTLSLSYRNLVAKDYAEKFGNI